MHELYVVTEAMARFRHYLLGNHFIIRTDQKSLKVLVDQKIQTPEQQLWLHKFLGFDFFIEYKPGRDNVAADALSCSFSMALSCPTSSLLHDLAAAIASDPALSTIFLQCMENKYPGTNYQYRQNRLYWNNRLVLPPNSDLVQKILTEFHSSVQGGHAGIKRTKARIASHFYWPSMAN